MDIRAKLDNFWYHYKWHTFAVIVALFFVVITIKSCSDRSEPDLKMIYFSTEGYQMDTAEKLEKSLRKEGLVKDIDGDGEARFHIEPLINAFDVDAPIVQGSAEKIQTVIYAGDHTLVLAHQYALEDYQQFFDDISSKAEEGHKTFTNPTEGYISGISVEGNSYLEDLGINTKDLYMAIRRRSEKEIENGTYDKHFELAYDVMDFILSHNK